MENSMEIPQKTKNLKYHMIHTSEENENFKDVHFNVHSGIIYNNQDKEAIAINRWMDPEVIHKHKYACCNITQPWQE